MFGLSHVHVEAGDQVIGVTAMRTTMVLSAQNGSTVRMARWTSKTSMYGDVHVSAQALSKSNMETLMQILSWTHRGQEELCLCFHKRCLYHLLGASVLIGEAYR
jgi:hypothetical protein